MTVIPEQQPIGDSISGTVIQVAEAQLLSLLADAADQTSYIVRYGLRYQGKLHLGIVPGLLVLDYGDILTGEEAWEFVLKHSNLYPRAEIMGYRNDGTEDMALVRTIDMAVPPLVLLYADETATRPVATVTALIAGPTTPLPERIGRYLARYDTLAGWQAAQHHD